MGRCPRSLKSASCKAALAIWPDRRTSLAGMPCCARQSGGLSGSAVGAGPAGLRAAPRRIELRSPANTGRRAQSDYPPACIATSERWTCCHGQRLAPCQGRAVLAVLVLDKSQIKTTLREENRPFCSFLHPGVKAKCNSEHNDFCRVL